MRANVAIALAALIAIGALSACSGAPTVSSPDSVEQPSSSSDAQPQDADLAGDPGTSSTGSWTESDIYTEATPSYANEACHSIGIDSAAIAVLTTPKLKDVPGDSVETVCGWVRNGGGAGLRVSIVFGDYSVIDSWRNAGNTVVLDTLNIGTDSIYVVAGNTGIAMAGDADVIISLELSFDSHTTTETAGDDEKVAAAVDALRELFENKDTVVGTFFGH